MGTKMGFIAAKVPSLELQAAVLRAWPFKIVDSKKSFRSEDAMWKWKESQEEFVSAAAWNPLNRGKSVLSFWQDGSWSVLGDWQILMSIEEDKLAKVSAEVGELLALAVFSTSGCAQALYFKDGVLLRQIGDFDGERVEKGDPLPQEAAFRSEPFYGHEEEFWTAFGLAPFENTPGLEGLRAITVVDQTDYGQRPVPVKPRSKPWWKFW